MVGKQRNMGSSLSAAMRAAWIGKPIRERFMGEEKP